MRNGRTWVESAALVAGMACGFCAVAAERSTWLVALPDAPLAAHVHDRLQASDPDAGHGTIRQAFASSDAEAYLAYLDEQRSRALDRIASQIGRPARPLQVFRHVNDGMALELDADEAARVAALPGIVAVRRERTLRLHTDAGPQWIGADQLWSGSVGYPATRGEGVVIGIIDTGINPGHPSFANAGSDGFQISNPRGQKYGLCASGQAPCNNKLIGIWDFSSEGTKGIDSVGHGSHVAGIAAGNAITDALQGHTVSLALPVSGVAPHANLISYKGCNSQPIDSNSEGTCAESALVAAINQAVADQVDVINFSIGGDAHDPYALLADPSSDVHAFFYARQAGIVVAVSAGNDGPDPGTISEPANAPWVVAVANATHDRRFANSIGTFSGAANPPPPLLGLGYTSGFGPAKIVYAGDYGNALCGTGATQGVTPDGASNPFPPGTFHGEIVICDRGTYARVEKGYNVKAAGAGGYVLANAASDGASIISDDHFLPAVHLTYDDGKALKAWVASAGDHAGTIGGVVAQRAAAYGDILDASSSRGPYGFSGGIQKPDITAPGDNILSAAQTGTGLALLSGTSMASPHVAGALALLVALHPEWTPAKLESALLGTALAGSVRREDGVTPASPLDAGSGRVQLGLAARAGLYLPLAAADYFAGSGSVNNPTAHGSLSMVNRVGIESESCAGHCNFVRTVADLSSGGTWQASAVATDGALLSVSPTQFTLAQGGSQPLAIALDVSAPQLAGTWVTGRILLHKIGGGAAASDFAMSVAALAATGAPQGYQSITAHGAGGYVDLPTGGFAELPDAAFATTSLAPAQVAQLNLGVDAQSADHVYELPASGRQAVLFPARASGEVGRVFVVEITGSNASQVVLYAGIDANGNGTPQAAEQICSATYTPQTPVARCVIDLHDLPAAAGQVWAVVDVTAGNAVNSVTVSGGVAMVPEAGAPEYGNAPFIVTGPGHVAVGANFPLRLAWGGATLESNGAIAPGSYYGAILVDSAPATGGQAGYLPFAFTRVAGGDDVADALGADAARTWIVEPGESLQHAFVDLPPGMSQVIVESSLVSGSGPLQLKLVYTDFPPPSASPAIAAAPTGVVGAIQWQLDAATPEQNIGVPNSLPGRRYLVVDNLGSSRTAVAIRIRLPLSANAQAPPLRSGNYFNPQRSGHGIFLSRAAGQQVVDWYTFREDGTPTWYLAQAAAPASNVGTWSADLYRATWNGSSGKPTRVGVVTLTTTSADHAMFSWHLDGSSGSEAFQLIAAPACVGVGGGSADLSGEWYAPAQSGYGFDALVLPGQQFEAFYLYDASGSPRWVVGGAGPFAVSSTIPMLQSSGFCPVCAYQQLATQSAGSLNLAYADGSTGHLSTAITLAAPLAGQWNVDQPMIRLTGAPACVP